jgi:hypothetical protein
MENSFAGATTSSGSPPKPLSSEETVLRNLCLQKKQNNPERTVLRQLSLEAVNILWEEQEGHRHAMTIGNAGSQSQHGGELSWWARGPRCLERIQEWEQWLQKCHTSNIDEGFDCVSFADGMICVEIKGEQQKLKIDMDNGERVDTNTNESSRREPIAETEASRQGDESLDMKTQKLYPFSKSKVWHGLPGNLEVVYAQEKELLHWEELARITKSLNTNLTSRKIIMDQGAWSDEEQTIAWKTISPTWPPLPSSGKRHFEGGTPKWWTSQWSLYCLKLFKKKVILNVLIPYS